MEKISKKASIWSGIGSIILILIGALIILLIISPGFRELFLGFSAIFAKYDRSEISNSTYFALTPESAGMTPDASLTPNKVLCDQKTVNGKEINEWRCRIYTDTKTGQTAYPRVNVFVNIKNGGTKLRVLYAKPIIGENCESISKCDARDFLQGTKKCSIAPGQTTSCEAGIYTFTKNGIYKIYPGYMCDVTITDGCFEPGATKAIESYTGQNNILIEIVTT
jgi:hypothetical protein